MDRPDAGAKIAALTAIIQTLIREHYWEADEEEARRRFLGMAEADHEVAMVIVNELTEEELGIAFRWSGGRDGGRASGLPESPVTAFLTEEQYERVRITTVAEDEGDRVRAFATQEPGLAGGRSLSVCERIRLAEERFVSAMVEDLAERGGVRLAATAKASTDETISAMPEPWKTRTKRELERLQEDLGAILGDERRGGANGAWKAEERRDGPTTGERGPIRA